MYNIRLKHWSTEPRKMPNAHSQNAYPDSSPPQPPTSDRNPVRDKKGTGWITQWVITENGHVFIFTVILWILVNGVVIRHCLVSEWDQISSQTWKDIYISLSFFNSSGPFAFSTSSSSLLCIRVLKQSLFLSPLPTVLCKKKMGHLYNRLFSIPDKTLCFVSSC